MSDDSEELPRLARDKAAHPPCNRTRLVVNKSPNRSQRDRTHRAKSAFVPRSSATATHPSSKSTCQVTMIYFGSQGQTESKSSEFESADEILVMQQHCGGENLIVHQSDLRSGGELSLPLPPSLSRSLHNLSFYSQRNSPLRLVVIGTIHLACRST